MLVYEKSSKINANELPLFGINDGVFIQHEDRPGLMTKREIRIQILADLELPMEGVIWDIGAGVGSIGIEALRIRPKLKLLSIEKRMLACINPNLEPQSNRSSENLYPTQFDTPILLAIASVS